MQIAVFDPPLPAGGTAVVLAGTVGGKPQHAPEDEHR
jgi:hypothetical protein